jgi:single-strand DNA-binding protein
MYNRVILIGNLTKDPELRYTPQGTPVANLRLASTSKFRSGEEMKEETLFIDIVVWGRQGETCSQHLSKGRSVLVEGRLQERKWESDGQKRSKFEVVAQTVRFLGKKEQGSYSAPHAQSEDAQSAPPEEITDIEPF